MNKEEQTYEWQVSTITGFDSEMVSLKWYPGKSRFVLVFDQPDQYIRVELTEGELKELTKNLNGLWKKKV